MTMIRILAVLPLLASVAAAPSTDAPVESATTLSRGLANQFQQEMGSALQGAIRKEGTAGAVTACATIAPEIAGRLSAQSGAGVRRTALRNRNPLAVPDTHESAAMAAMVAAPVDAAGKPAESAGWVGSGADRRFRYVRAIPTAPMCVSCHGTDIAPDVARAIATTYPGDRATGFAPGDMRGAFSISWTPNALAAALAKVAKAH